MVDDSGEPVWFLPLGSTTAMDVRVQTYQGRPVLTWYEGTVLGAEGGSWVIFDPTYHEVARVQAGNGRHGDLHDLQLARRRAPRSSPFTARSRRRRCRAS